MGDQVKQAVSWVRLKRYMRIYSWKVTRGAARAGLTQVRRKMGTSDISHWRRNDSLDPSWEDRVAVMAKRIEPGSRVLDIGAGAQTMRRHLPPNCAYLPLDVVARTPDTIVCDLNDSKLPTVMADWAIASGVLEYLMNVPQFLTELASTSQRAVISYVVPKPGESVFERRTIGWVNDFTQTEIEDIFVRCGFSVAECEQWGGQLIFWLTLKEVHEGPG